jgi:recombination associated protein RdgC
MIFKNLNIYRIKDSVSQAELNAYLGKSPFTPCLPNQPESAGFQTLFGLGTRVFTANDCHLLSLKVEEKVLPPAAVKAEYKKALQEQETRLSRKLNKTEREALRESTKEAMYPRAFCRPSEVWAYVDCRAKLLVINTTSAKTADGLAMTIKGCLPSKFLMPLKANDDISQHMTLWLTHDAIPAPFSMGSKCEIGDGEGTIRYKNRLLSDEHLQEYLKDDMKATTLSLGMEGRMEFVLTEDFVIKEFVLSDELLAKIDVGAGDHLSEVVGQLELMSTEVRELVEQLLTVLGGEDI